MAFIGKIPHRENYFYTFYLVLTVTTYGIMFSLFPNITVDMKYILNTSMSMISLYTTVDTVGRIVGTAVPLFYKYLNRQVVVAIIFILLTISCAVIPVLPNLWLLFVCAFVSGLCASVISCAYTVWMIEMWKSQSGKMLQITEFGFGIGSILAPVIMKPYLVGEIGTGDEQQANQFSGLVNEEISATDRRNRLMWPTLITGACILPIPIASLIMYFIKPYKPPEEKSDQNDNNTNKEEIKLFDRPETPRKTMRILCALWYSTYVIFETVFLKFAVTYFQYCPQRMTAQKAAEIFSISTAVFTGFRGINVFVALKVKMIHMIYYHYVILIIGMILLIFGQNSMTLLSISSFVLCCGFASMFAGIFSFTGEQMTVTNQLSTGFILIRALLTLVTPIVIGYYVEEYSMIFVIIEAFYLIASLVFFAVIIFMINKYSNQAKVEREQR